MLDVRRKAPCDNEHTELNVSLLNVPYTSHSASASAMSIGLRYVTQDVSFLLAF